MAATTSSIRYNPLTTVFTPPAHCASDAWTWDGLAGLTVIEQNYFETSTGHECFPSSVGYYYAVYSPGICPLGFSTAHTSIIEGSITGAQCCPTYVIASPAGIYDERSLLNRD